MRTWEFGSERGEGGREGERGGERERDRERERETDYCKKGMSSSESVWVLGTGESFPTIKHVGDQQHGCHCNRDFP